MLTISNVSDLVKLETEYNAAVEHLNAARETADSADFRFRTTLEVCEHAINLQRALERNRLLDSEEAYNPVYRVLMIKQRETEASHRHADAAYRNAHIAAKKSFHALEEARKSATVGAP